MDFHAFSMVARRATLHLFCLLAALGVEAARAETSPDQGGAPNAVCIGLQDIRSDQTPVELSAAAKGCVDAGDGLRATVRHEAPTYEPVYMARQFPDALPDGTGVLLKKDFNPELAWAREVKAMSCAIEW